MLKIKIQSNNGRDTLYAHGTPNPNALSKSDYSALIANLEYEISSYYKGQSVSNDDNNHPP